jgi:AcrR family transcriptional regulator
VPRLTSKDPERLTAKTCAQDLCLQLKLILKRFQYRLRPLSWVLEVQFWIGAAQNCLSSEYDFCLSLSLDRSKQNWKGGSLAEISQLRSSNSMQDSRELLSMDGPKTRGRHRSLEAEASILKAALYLLERKPLRQVTTDAIARRAGVSKATIYKWWPNKSMVALDAYLGGMTERVSMPDTGSAEVDFTVQLKSVTTFYKSSLGRLFCQFLAEGQSDPGFLALFRDRFLYARRDAARVMWRRGVDRGEIRKEIDSEIVLDLIYGPMVFRLLAGHGSLNDHESEAMIEAIFGGLRHPGHVCPRNRKRKGSNRDRALKTSLSLSRAR